jgi:hypothetical protein
MRGEARERKVNEFYKKQLIARWAQSLVPETCRGAVLFPQIIRKNVQF